MSYFVTGFLTRSRLKCVYKLETQCVYCRNMRYPDEQFSEMTISDTNLNHNASKYNVLFFCNFDIYEG